METDRPVILDLIQNPQGGVAIQTNHVPLSLDGRGIKGEGEHNPVIADLTRNPVG